MSRRDWHWRNTSRLVMLGPLEIAALAPYVILLFVHSMMLFYFALSLTAFMVIARYFGWSAKILLITIRSKIAGRRVSARKKFFNWPLN